MLQDRLADMPLAHFVVLHPGRQPLTRPGSTGRVREERTPATTCPLAPGDWYDLPHGGWHAPRARSDCLSISLGVTL
jgi:hypothetical protein